MGILERIKGAFKKFPARYILQEYDYEERAWRTIDQSDQAITIDNARLRFRPGCLYRVVEMNIETGKFERQVWKHYEPDLRVIGVAKPEEEEEKPKRRKRKKVTPADVMRTYARQLNEMLQPLVELQEVLNTLGNLGAGSSTAQPPQQGFDLPPLQFKGEAPWYLHPYIVSYVGNMVKDVTDFFNRLERTLKGKPEEVPVRPPSIEEYLEGEEYVEEPPTAEIPAFEEEEEYGEEEEVEEEEYPEEELVESEEEGVEEAMEGE